MGLKGHQTTLNGKNIKTSDIKSLEKSYLCTSGLYFDNEEFRNSFKKLVNKTKYHRFGGDCYMYGMVASGLIEIVVEDTLKAHDYMALIPILKGAGGEVTDKYGKEVNINSDGSIVASANQELHKKIIDIINN